MEEKKIPKEIRMVTCGMSKHIQNRRPVPPPPTHGMYNNEKPSRTRRNFCERLFKNDEILREGHFARKGFWEKDICEKGILQERNFSRKGFWEKGILREESDWLILRILESKLIDSRVKRLTELPLAKDCLLLLERSNIMVRTCGCAHKSLEYVINSGEFYGTYIAQTGIKYIY